MQSRELFILFFFFFLFFSLFFPPLLFSFSSVRRTNGIIKSIRSIRMIRLSDGSELLNTFDIETLYNSIAEG